MLSAFSRARQLVLLLLALFALPAQAQFKVNSSFRNSTEPGWTITGTDNSYPCGFFGCTATNDDSGILTGGYGAITATNTNDASGNGWLRITTDQNGNIGRALYTGGSFPSTLGVVVEFDYISWGGSGADGLSFFLYDANGTMAGALSGAGLGYCEGNGAYLGVGLDEFGNFSGSAPGGVSGGCDTGGTPTPDRVVVRGPTSIGGVNGSNSNPIVGSASVGGSLDTPNVTTRPTPSRVRYFLVPNGSGGYRVSVFYGPAGGTQTAILSSLSFPYAAPANLRIGIGGSTGGLNNIHEVRNATVSAPADILVTKTVSASTVLRGQPVSYTVKIKNNDINPADPGDQSPAINAANAADIADVFPAQLSNVSWTCVATAGSSCPAASGTGSLNYTTGYSLAPGGELTFTVNASVGGSASCGATVTNTATADFSSTDGFADIDPTNNAASASFTVACPQVVVQKISQGGTGTFGFGGDNGIANHNIVTTASGTPANGATQTLALAGTATTINETALASGFVLTGISCSGLGSGGTFTPDLANHRVVLDAAATTTAGPITCTFTNTRQASLKIVKSVPSGQQGTAFDFTQSGMPATASGSPNPATDTAFALNPSVAAGSNLTDTQTYTNVTPGVAITVNELATANTLAYSVASLTCADASGAPTGSTVTTTVNNAALAGQPKATATVNLVPGADVTCTFNNVRNARIAVVKNAVGGDGTFDYTATTSLVGSTISPSNPSIATSSGTGSVNTVVSGLTSILLPTTVTLTEAAVSGWQLTGIACTNLLTGTPLTTSTVPSATVDLAQRRVVLDGVLSGNQLSCSFTNVRKPLVTIRKQSNGGTGSFSFGSGSNGLPSSLNLDTSSANPASSVAHAIADVTQPASLTETVPTGWTLNGWACLNASSQVVASGATAGMSLPASALDDGNDLVCTFTNTRNTAMVALAKTWSGAVVNDTAELSATGAATNPSLNSTANSASETDTGTAVAVDTGTTLALSEVLGAGNVGQYNASAWNCTGTSGLSGATLVVGQGDSNIVCTLGNTRRQANLSIAKTNNATTLVSGSSTTYTITATNSGLDAADGATISDTPGSGLGSCQVSSCSSTGGATCPAIGTSVPPAGASYTATSFPSGSTITIGVTCVVN